MEQMPPPEIGRYVFLEPDDGSRPEYVGVVLYQRPDDKGVEEPMAFRMPYEIAEEFMVHVLDFLKKHGYR